MSPINTRSKQSNKLDETNKQFIDTMKMSSVNTLRLNIIIITSLIDFPLFDKACSKIKKLQSETNHIKTEIAN